MQNWKKLHPGMQSRERKRMTNRAVLAIKIGRYALKRGKRGDQVYKKRRREREGRNPI